MDYVSLFLDNIQFALSLRNSEFFSHCCTIDMNIMVGIESISSLAHFFFSVSSLVLFLLDDIL